MPPPTQGSGGFRWASRPDAGAPGEQSEVNNAEHTLSDNSRLLLPPFIDLSPVSRHIQVYLMLSAHYTWCHPYKKNIEII